MLVVFGGSERNQSLCGAEATLVIRFDCTDNRLVVRAQVGVKSGGSEEQEAVHVDPERGVAHQPREVAACRCSAFAEV